VRTAIAAVMTTLVAVLALASSSRSTTTAGATARSICSRQRSSRNSIRKNPASWILIRSGRSRRLDQSDR